MTVHERAMRLAAAALDFRLSDADVAEVRAHLAGCDACRRQVEGLRADAAALERVLNRAGARDGASAQVRERVLAEAATTTGRSGSTWLTLQAALLLVIATTLVLLGFALVAGSRGRLMAVEPTKAPPAVEYQVSATVDIADRLPPEPDYCRISSGDHRTPDCRIGLAAGAGSVWATAGRGVVRVDALTNEVLAAIELPSDPRDMVFFDGLVYVATWDGTLQVIDPETDSVSGRIVVADSPLSALATGPAGSLWVTVRAIGEVVRVDPVAASVIARATVGGEPYDIAVAGGSAWVTDRAGEWVTRIDTASNEVVDRVALNALQPRDIVATSSGVWLAGGSELVKVDSASGTHLPLVPAPALANLAAGSSGLWVVAMNNRQVLLADPEHAGVVGRVSLADVITALPDSEAAMLEVDGSLWIAGYGSPGLIRVGVRP